MNENFDLAVSWGATGIASSTALTASNIAAGFNTVLQYVIVALPVIAAIVSIAYTIYKWAKRASADKKITQEEMDEFIQIIGEGGKKISEALPKEEETLHE